MMVGLPQAEWPFLSGVPILSGHARGADSLSLTRGAPNQSQLPGRICRPRSISHGGPQAACNAGFGKNRGTPAWWSNQGLAKS